MRTLLATFFVLAFVGSASALTQPNGTTIPSAPGCNAGKPDGLAAIFACQCDKPNVCNLGAPCASQTSCDDGKHATCETTVWHSFNDNTCLPSNHSGLDPVADASLTPDTFHPICGLTFTVVTRGNARFQNAFGWYNVTGQKPDPSDLHVILDCAAAPGAQQVLDVKNDPAYKGGDIGFFLVTPETHGQRGTCAAGNCCATTARATVGEGWLYYSQRQFNSDNTGPSSFVHLLIYDSKIVQRKFYFAWEDIYGGNDNEFADLVTSVQGVECSGGGTVCSTGKGGVCDHGINRCEKGTLSCLDLYQPAPEICDGLDNNCNGIVDDGATCPRAGDVCSNGECVPHCAQSSEFACSVQMSCDATTGLCADPACAGVTCAADKVCRAGHCLGACDGIVCPHGSECRLGSCVNPCKSVTCPAMQVCAGGLCVAGCNQCAGLTCVGADKCDAVSGTCFDPSCANGCAPGTFCASGVCKDACDGAVCPANHVCSAGECVLTGGGNGDGGAQGPGGGNPGQGGGPIAGCGCEARPTNAHASWLFVTLLAGGFVRPRRRR